MWRDRLKIDTVREQSAIMKAIPKVALGRRLSIAIAIVVAIGISGFNLLNAQQPSTNEDFNRYVAIAETRISKERNSSFLRLESTKLSERDDLLRKLRGGEVVIEKQGDIPEQISNGLVHDWVGTVFIPRATVAQVVALVRDYNHTANYYGPDVMQSRLISANGDDLHVFMRLQKHKVVTVVLDTEYDVHYGRIDAEHQYSVSRSTRVSEIADPGTSKEHPLPAGQDHGFMWRLNSYWAFEQTVDGVLVECEAISLTRDIPSGLGWMVGPFVNSIPRESLEFTLKATRAAVEAKQSGSKNHE
jgi:hypothetical protein